MLPKDIFVVKFSVLRVGLLNRISPNPVIECTVVPAPITFSISPTSSPTLNLVVFAEPTVIMVVPAPMNLSEVNPAVNTVL